jgi:hypothetical protein
MGVNADEPSSTGRNDEDPVSEQDVSARLKQLQAQAEIIRSSLNRGMADHSAFDQVLIVFLAGNFSSAFVQALGQRAGNKAADLAKRAGDVVEHLVKREDGSNELHIRGKNTETAMVVVTSETPDEARLALLDLDVTADEVRGKTLRWDETAMAWRADNAEE